MNVDATFSVAKLWTATSAVSRHCVNYTVPQQRQELPSSCRPAAAYRPWFGVVLKSARLAVKILTLLSEEVGKAQPAGLNYA